MINKYKYRYRPGYGSDNLLIEFISGVDTENFIDELFEAIKSINPKIIGTEDLWTNSEVQYTVNSNLGQFNLSKDIWGFAFIMAEDNQNCVTQINELLVMSNLFKKEEVDFNNYKTSRLSNNNRKRLIKMTMKSGL